MPSRPVGQLAQELRLLRSPKCWPTSVRGSGRRAGGSPQTTCCRALDHPPHLGRSTAWHQVDSSATCFGKEAASIGWPEMCTGICCLRYLSFALLHQLLHSPLESELRHSVADVTWPACRCPGSCWILDHGLQASGGFYGREQLIWKPLPAVSMTAVHPWLSQSFLKLFDPFLTITRPFLI